MFPNFNALLHYAVIFTEQLPLMKLGLQQDAHEFLVHVIDSCNEL